MFRKLYKRFKERRHHSIRSKLNLSIGALVATLLASSVISIMEYYRMSDYVSSLISGNIKNINVARKLSDVTKEYNLEMLKAIGDGTAKSLPDFNQQEFMSHCDSLSKSIQSSEALPLMDSVVYAYSAYMLASMELNDVLLSDFIDTRAWYFERLQPIFDRLTYYIDALSGTVYDELERNSLTFERGFFRSIIPGAVAVGAALLLVLLLYFFITVDYVNPIYKMLAGLDAYRSNNKKYNYTFDGDDQLSELNDGITELTGENQLLRKRVNNLRSKLSEAKNAAENKGGDNPGNGNPGN